MGQALGTDCKLWEGECDADGDDPAEQVQDDPKARRKYVLPQNHKLTVMMFGMTGAGKSSLGNLMADGQIFEAGDDTASVTNTDSIMKYEAEDGALVLLDTIGLGDTEINQEKVVSSIRDVALSAPNGVDCLFYVMRNARITDDAISRLIYVTEYLWGDDSLMNLYIVVTDASKYAKNRKAGEEWIQRQVEINWRFKHIYGIVGKNSGRFLFIDNPDPSSGELQIEERRESSHQEIFKALCRHPRDAVPPFTQAMMKQVAEMTKVERAQLDAKAKEVQRLKGELKKKQPKKKAKSSKMAKIVEEPTTEAEIELERYLQKAREDMKVAQQAMNAKLDQVKADSSFQQAATRQAEIATTRFTKDFQSGTGEKAQAAVSMMSALSKRLFQNKEKTEQKAKTTSASVMEPAEIVKPTEEQIKEILNTLRKSPQCQETPAQLFRTLGGWSGAGAIQPMVFTKFVLTAVPGVQQAHVGALWWRADTNCDGQVDLQELKDFFENHVNKSGTD